MPADRPNPFKIPEQTLEFKDVQQKPMVEELLDDMDLREFYRLREINRQVPPDKTDYLNRFAEGRLADYKASKSKIRVFVIRDQRKIIAGGQLELEPEQKRAYLGMKFVNEDQRGKSLASELVKKRVEVAKETGCETAYSLVRKENYAALRTITKDGFDISSTSGQQGMGYLKDEYFVYRDLTTDEPPTKVELAKVLKAIGVTELSASENIIPLNNRESIERAFQNGFVGKFVFSEKDNLPNITEPVMYLEKLKVE